MRVFLSIASIVVFGFAQAPAAPPVRVAAVQVKGVKRYTPEEVTRLSGIEIGRTISVNDLAAAANQLSATGLFDNVRYSYTTTAGTMSVTFDVAEAAWTVPVILDNFVWATDQEWIARLRQEVPSFDGTSPANGGASDFLTRSLQKLLKARGVPGTVHFTPHADLKTRVTKYVFSVKDPSPTICALRVSGNAAVPERDLVAPLQGTIGGDYSRFSLATTANGTLTDIYRRKGFWRAAFGVPVTALDSCQGVAVSLPVSEGPQYAWDRAEWSGNQVMGTDLLNKALGIKAGDIADVDKIESGLRAVRDLYGRQGYLMHATRFEPKLDDPSHRAVFAMMVEEGPQFRMGTIAFEGIREADATTLGKRWRLKAGDVYDDSYETTYFREVLAQVQTTAGVRGRIERNLDTDRHVVDVKIVFK